MSSVSRVVRSGAGRAFIATGVLFVSIAMLLSVAGAWRAVDSITDDDSLFGFTPVSALATLAALLVTLGGLAYVAATAASVARDRATARALHLSSAISALWVPGAILFATAAHENELVLMLFAVVGASAAIAAGTALRLARS